MADFYPLIAKAVAALPPDASSESRRVLYDRVRAALLSELRMADPPFTASQIMHERLALEDAVSRVEEEVQAIGDKLAGADDTGIRVEIPWSMVTGSATGRLDQVWRLRLNADSRPRVQPVPSAP